MHRLFTCSIMSLALAVGPAAAQVNIDFDELTLPPGQEFDNGAPADGGDNNDGFASNGVSFSNDFTDFGSFTAWDGFSYSAVNDTTTQGFSNQYAAFPGTGFNSGDDIYAVSFGADRGTAVITLPVATTVQEMYVTNTTWAALSMLNGDQFAKQFGGPSGNDPDFFRLNIFGIDEEGEETGSVTVDLADYTFDDNTKDFILDEWEQVDLSVLGNEVAALEFSMDSSDVGDFGINTPTYFAMDNLILNDIPEPGTVGLMGLGAAGLILRRRRSIG